MAKRTPALVQVLTSTTGTGSYTLTDTSPGVGFRTIAEAVADSSLVNGDQIFYEIRDSTAAGSANLFERGIGTLNTGTLVLTRDQIFEGSNGTSAVSWGAGSRDCLIATPSIEVLPLLAVANVFTLLQTIRLSGSGISPSAETALVLERSAAAAHCYAAIIGAADASSQLRFSDPSAGEGGGGIIAYFNSTFPSIAHTFRMYTAGVHRLSLSAAGLQDAAGLRYVAVAGGGVTKWLWGSAPPTGWTRSNEADDRVIKTAKSSESAGDSGGSWTVSGLSVSGSTDSTVLSILQMPEHDHAYNTSTGSGGSAVGLKPDGSGSGIGSASSATGGGTGHAHGLTGASVASAGSWRPLYKVWVAATLD